LSAHMPQRHSATQPYPWPRLHELNADSAAKHRRLQPVSTDINLRVHVFVCSCFVFSFELSPGRGMGAHVVVRLQPDARIPDCRSEGVVDEAVAFVAVTADARGSAPDQAAPSLPFARREIGLRVAALTLTR
jgi:hypothetical protein